MGAPAQIQQRTACFSGVDSCCPCHRAQPLKRPEVTVRPQLLAVLQNVHQLQLHCACDVLLEVLADRASRQCFGVRHCRDDQLQHLQHTQEMCLRHGFGEAVTCTGLQLLKRVHACSSTWCQLRLRCIRRGMVLAPLNPLYHKRREQQLSSLLLGQPGHPGRLQLASGNSPIVLIAAVGHTP